MQIHKAKLLAELAKNGLPGLSARRLSDLMSAYQVRRGAQVRAFSALPKKGKRVVAVLRSAIRLVCRLEYSFFFNFRGPQTGHSVDPLSI